MFLGTLPYSNVLSEEARDTKGFDFDIEDMSYQDARWHPIHFQPAIQKATNEQCLTCHQEIIGRRVADETPAGLKTDQALAWYQTLDTYTGPQETLHRRHLVTGLAENYMDFQCTTCHQGHDPREEAPNPPTSNEAAFTLRKAVNTEEVCLKCHGDFNYEIMGLPGPWHEVKQSFGNDCLTCHVAIRTNRHEVNYLDATAIEEAGRKNSDSCYGCHGGRAWYRISYPYPRHPWPGMPEETPEWAEDRPTESAPRFLDAADNRNPSTR
jgi:nitrate/TMAO reductase-like tetraheme cytochrome c subunit